jgi:hypothetical protein
MTKGGGVDMNTLIVWSDGGKVTLYVIPTVALKVYDPEHGFGVCHNHRINGRENEEVKPDVYNRIEYLAWLLGEEPHFGPLPTLAEWLAVNRQPEDLALSTEKRKSGKRLEKEAVPPFATYKTDVIVTAWDM